jgi:hypothetical protein
MPHRKIANWTTIHDMFRQRYVAQAAEEVEVKTVVLYGALFANKFKLPTILPTY